jgi:drug/metabolite transporter (DMT)-like permease
MAPNPAPRAPTTPAASALDPRLIGSLAAVYVVWSSTYLVMRYAVRELPPMLMGSLRFVFAGLVLLVLARRRGAAWPSARAWREAAPLGICFFVGGNGFVAVAEQTISSGTAAVVCATMPLWVAVFGIFVGERPRAIEWASLALGFVGVVVLVGGPSLSGPPLHVVLLVLSPVAWALGSLWARRARPGQVESSLIGPGLQMITGGLALGVLGLLRGEELPRHASVEAWLALAYLTAFGSLVAFTAYGWLLRHARPVVATSYAYVNPILAVAIGAAVGGEGLGTSTLIANAIIVAAVVLALRSPRTAGKRP